MPGRKFKFEADHAVVKVLGRRETKKLGFRARSVVQRKAWEPLPKSYSAAICLANLLYPKNFPRIITSGLDKKTTFSEWVKVDRPSQKAIKLYYHRSGYSTAYVNHATRVRLKALPILEKIEKESGITANLKAMNIGFRKKTPVFFEIAQISLKKLREKIRAMPEGKKKLIATSLLKILLSDTKRFGINGDSIFPHY